MVTEGTEDVVLETPEEQTPTETEIEALRAKLQEAEAKAQTEAKARAELEKSYKGLQTTVKRKDDQLKEQVDLHTRLNNFEEKLKLLAVAQSLGRTEESLESISDKERQDLLGRFDDLDKRYKTNVEAEKQKQQQEEYNEKATTIWGRAEKLGLTDEDEDYWYIWDALSRDGNLRKAEVKVAKLEKAKQPVETPAEPKETEEALRARLEKEILEKHGLLVTDSAIPSGRSASRDELYQRYIDGDRSEEVLKAIQPR